MAGQTAGGTQAPDLTCDSRLDALPGDVVTTAFTLDQGDSAVVTAEGRVFLVTVDAVKPADPADDEVQALTGAVERGLAGEVDGGHAAAGDWAVDNVTPVQCRACAQGCHVHQSRIADRERTNES